MRFMQEVTVAEGFRPFLIPEYGWFAIIPGLGFLWYVFSGRALRDMRKQLLPSAPVFVELAFLVIFGVAGIAAGVGLLLESERVTTLAILVAVPAMLIAFVLSSVYRRPGEPDPPAW